MFRYASRRFYLGVIGLLLLTVPLFAGMRFEDRHGARICLASVERCHRPGVELPPRAHDGPLYLAWYGGLPPGDYWPLAAVIIGATASVELAVRSRRRGRRPTLA